ncbi:EscU/YscU/HrcU family type III secretion system export apparatus switch protein [Histidinibacterium aquaticum]|uniref:Flagellar biosynthesis protein FlhB n=1 Tax=Histidinibacterium aquaticum TaxID=2613962 RepID=A0A5J5GRF7_9RHOB|nr:flagellar type III secretion system protein FlhB [Histidinibacterium aquaticum]KAA9009952.1 flagellar biosynthesis protein FlhB [Histidinibacterium aquaticum]
MADEEDKQNKTEQPTERKLKKARDQGDVPASKETGTAMTVFSLMILSAFLIPSVGVGLVGALRGMIDMAGQTDIGSGARGLSDLAAASSAMTREVGRVLAPVFIVMILGALFGVLIQGETVVSLERIKPKGSKISPVAGLKRLFSADTMVEFLKNTLKVAIVAAIGTWIARRAVSETWMGILPPEGLLAFIRSEVTTMLIATTVLLVPIAIGDILWKRAQWTKKQKMSHKELRDEHKESEGDPHLKNRRTDIRRERARQRIAVAVPGASVVITNPTHYAVALRYEPGRDSAPVCVAKGADHVAARIRKLARENDVPILENKPLARSLHAVAEVDEVVPVEHWQALAEIISFVMDLRRNIRRAPPAGSSLRDEL